MPKTRKHPLDPTAPALPAIPSPELVPLRAWPFLPLRDVVVFPQMVIPIFVGRQTSVTAVESAMAGDRKLVVATQTDPRQDEPALKDLHRFGTLAEILQVLKLPDGTLKVLIEGSRRVRLVRLDPPARMTVQLPDEPRPAEMSVALRALMRSVIDQFQDYIKLNRRVPPEVVLTVQNLEDPGVVADIICANLILRVSDKQALLETVDPVQRLERLTKTLHQEIEILSLERRIRHQVSKQMEESQREYYLNEQLKAIQKELGKKDGADEIKELAAAIVAAGMPEEARAKAGKELRRLEKMAPLSAEASVVRTYLDWLIELPWAIGAKSELNLTQAQEILDADHYGLKDAKERILEYLAVMRLVKKIKGQILCFVGPPGVGKTSVARSIARAMGRQFVRLSLGGVRDEAEIRGHRRTYVGSLPGRIIQSVHKVKSKNPVFLLDEIDKMSSDFRGDPAAALLEVLDPEQNATFSDHYLEVPFDLSDVFFITTANTLYEIPLPLRDRMEIIRFPGYSEYEKLQIATRFLVPKQLEANGLEKLKIDFTIPALKEILRRYTREAGVRNLEREIASVCRKIASAYVRSNETKPGKGRGTKTMIPEELTPAAIRKYLGVPRYRVGEAEEKAAVGVAQGLAWTEAGGEILQIEAAFLRGKGGVILTGQLGDVMKESAQAAVSYARANAARFHIPADFYKTCDLHIHVPEGAIPKDGPSAGSALAVAVISALSKRKVRHGIAMTGEITLHGKILPVGGIKEKILAALRAGINEIILPSENEKDLSEIPPRERQGLKVHLVRKMDEVVKHVFA